MEALQEIITTVLLSVVGMMITVAGSLLTKWLSAKIKNEKVRTILEQAVNVVTDGVVYVHQTYVEGLKGTSLWDSAAMAEANKQASSYIKNNLPKEVEEYLNSQGKNVEEWIQEQVEIAVQRTK